MKEKILRLYSDKNYKALGIFLSQQNAVDIALAMSDIENAAQAVIFRLLPKDTAARVFVELDEQSQVKLIEKFSDSELGQVVDELYVDDAVDIIEEMPANAVKRIISRASPEMRKMINDILKYPQNSVGSIMNTEFITFKPHMSVNAALAHVRRYGRDTETVSTVYVVSKEQRLMGSIAISELIFSEPECLISGIMESHGTVSVNTFDDREEAALTAQKYSLDILPVVDGEQRLVGIVTAPDLADVIVEEAAEDIEVMAAITPKSTPYFKQKTLSIFKNRVLWLAVLMLSATFTGIIISGFENALSAVPILSAFIPMLMGTGGNAGAQASATVIRGLSLDEIRAKDVLRVIIKELRVGVLCGAVLSVLMFIKMLTVDRLIMGSEITAIVAAAVCLTLFCTVIAAKIAGGFLPLAAKKLGFDPAVMASPFITTLTDTVSLLVYFTIASRLLGI